MQNYKVIVTTSWDDGHTLDLKLADLLHNYNLAGTFYISPEDREITPTDRLHKDQIKILSNNFEIGAHTLTHPKLSAIDDAMARQEIVLSKKALEDIVGHEVKSFCYPSGDYQQRHKQIVKDAGFSLARTVKRFSTSLGNDLFELPTTVHAYRHWSDISPIFNEAGATHFINHYLNWDDLAIALFDNVRATGGVFHIWGHSWELEKHRDWDRLERVFKHISNIPEVDYVTNGELI